MTDWKTRAIKAEAEVERLRDELAQRDERRGGRPPTKAKTADAMLVAQAIAATGWTRTALAKSLGVDMAVLSRVNKIPLAEHHRGALQALLAKHAPVAPSRRAKA